MTTVSPRTQTSLVPFDIRQSSASEQNRSFMKAGTSGLTSLVSTTAIAIISHHVAIGGFVLASVCPPAGLIISCVALVVSVSATGHYLKKAHYYSPEQVQIRSEKIYEKKLKLNLKKASENKILAENEVHLPNVADPETIILNPNLRIVTFFDPDIGQDKDYKDIYSEVKTDEDETGETLMLKPRTVHKIRDITDYLSLRQDLKKAGCYIEGSMIDFIRKVNKNLERRK